MSQKTLSIFAILSVIAIVGFSTDVYAQTEIPDELRFITPIHAGLTEVATTFSFNIIQIIGSLIILGIGYGVGRMVEKSATILLTRMTKFGEGHEQLKGIVNEANNSMGSQINLIPVTLKWFVYIIFIIASVNALGLQYLSDALQNLWLWIPNILASVILLILGTILVRFIDKWILSQKFFGSEEESGKGARTIIKIVIYSVIVAIAITQLGVGSEIIPTLIEAFAWGIAGAFALGVGLAGYKIIPSYVNAKDNERMGLIKGNDIITLASKDETTGEQIPEEEVRILQVGITKIKVQNKDGHIRFIPHEELEHYIFGLKENKEEKSSSS